MKKISVIIFILVCSVFAKGQTSTQTNWQPLISLDDSFTVETPIKLNFQEFGKDKTNRRYSNKFNNTYFFVFVDENKIGKPDAIWQYQSVLGFVKSNTLNGEKGKFSPYDAEKFDFVDLEGFYHKVIMVKTITCFYVFQTISQNPNDEIAERFFESLKIEGNSSEFTHFSHSENKEKTNEVPNKKVDLTVSSDGIGVGNGNVSGNEVRSPESTKTQTQTIQPTPLTIKSKEKPPYTNYAKFYQIEGSILLRVTFLASGKIGSISPVTKLPFGLTTNAIEAAKMVTFEPATRNGVPYSVVKQLQYTFTMY